MTFQEQIDNILDEFNFERIHDMMEAVGWTWGSPPEAFVPEVGDLRKAARKHLQSLRTTGLSASGGFTALNDDGVLNLFWGEDSMCFTDGVEPEEGE